LAFSGCTRVERETIVEQPVIEKETVVEKPVPSREVVVERRVADPRSCAYNSSAFSHGSVSCQASTEFRCDDGTWRNTYNAC
jgi:hypothetical protein